MRRLLLVLSLVSVIAPLSARADHPVDRFGCPKHIDDLSASNPLEVDPSNDWNGVVTGNASATYPWGEIYREGADITAIWYERDEEGTITAHIQIQNLGDMQPNNNYYFTWTYEGGDELRRQRWVGARLKGYAINYGYGYESTNPVTGNNQYVTEGDTTGSVKTGPNGVISIVLPKGGITFSGVSNDAWGAPEIGGVFTDTAASATILRGSPEPLPPNPAGLRHGFVDEVDAVDPSLCGAVINAR